MNVIAASGITIGIGGVIYVILLLTLGIISIRKGHWVMFIIGILIPLFWIIGALLPPTADAAARGR
jgi:hypothetical protein